MKKTSKLFLFITIIVFGIVSMVVAFTTPRKSSYKKYVVIYDVTVDGSTATLTPHTDKTILLEEEDEDYVRFYYDYTYYSCYIKVR